MQRHTKYNREQYWMMKALGATITPKKVQNFYETSRMIWLGTKREWSSYDKNVPGNWAGIEFPSEFAHVIWSQQGTYKSVFLKTVLPYFYARGYKIFIFEAKDGTLARSLKQNVQCEKIYPSAYSIKLPIVSYLPSYLTSPNLSDADVIPTEETGIFDHYSTIFASQINSNLEWGTLFRSSDTGGDILHILNKRFNGDLTKIYKSVQKGVYYDETDQQIKIHPTTQNSILRVLMLIKTDDAINSKRGIDVDIEKLWTDGNVGVMSFYEKRPEYMKIYVSKMYGKFRMYSLNHPGTKMLIVHDDSQCYLNSESDTNNPANAAVKNSIRFGRAYGYNNIFTVQEMKDFNESIFSLRTALFAGLITDFFYVRLNSEIKDVIDYNRRVYKEQQIMGSSLKQKTIRYVYIPRNETMSMPYYIQDPNCGGY